MSTKTKYAQRKEQTKEMEVVTKIDTTESYEEDDEVELGWGEVFLYYLKKLWVPLTIGVVTIIAFLTLNVVKQKGLDDYFISPTTEDLLGHDDEYYIVATYYSGQETSLSFVKHLKQLEKEYDIPFYLINISEYEGVIEKWEISYLPTYFVFYQDEETENKLGDDTVTHATMLYKSYGDKNASYLKSEIDYIVENGMPINNTGSTFSIDSYVSITLNSVELNDDNQIEASFTLTNDSSSSTTYSLSLFSAKPYEEEEDTDDTEEDTEEDDTTLTNESSEENITVDAGSSQTFTVTFSGYEDVNKIVFNFSNDTISDTILTWTIKK